MTLRSITMTGTALPGTASDTPPWLVRVTKALLGYGVVADALASAGSHHGTNPRCTRQQPHQVVRWWLGVGANGVLLGQPRPVQP